MLKSAYVHDAAGTKGEWLDKDKGFSLSSFLQREQGCTIQSHDIQTFISLGKIYKSGIFIFKETTFSPSNFKKCNKLKPIRK